MRRTDEAILGAVSAGASVEPIRVSRCHDGRGNRDDQTILHPQGRGGLSGACGRPLTAAWRAAQARPTGEGRFPMTLSVEQHSCEWGMTFHPPGDGPFPAVLVLHGSEGGWSGYSYMNAVMLAAHGFLAMPLPYSKGGNSWHAGDIRDVALDRTMRALAALRALPRAAGRAGVYGVSRGAEHALLFSALMARDRLADAPDAVAVLSPTDAAQGAFISARTLDEGGPERPSSDEPDLPAWMWNGSHDGLTPGSPIEIERYDGPLLIAQGTEDQLWPADMTRRLVDRLHRHGRSPEVHWYEGQGHGAWGETANLHWEKVIAFFGRHLARSA